MRGDLFDNPRAGVEATQRRLEAAQRGVMLDPPQGRPENRKYKIDLDVLTHKVHARVFQVLTVSPLPRFDAPPPKHLLARHCTRSAKEEGGAKYYGNDYNRVQICICGRSRAWPTWSKTPRGQWLGRSGWRGRNSWSKREVLTGGGPLFGNRGLTLGRLAFLIVLGIVVFAALQSGALDQLLGK